MKQNSCVKEVLSELECNYEVNKLKGRVEEYNWDAIFCSTCNGWHVKRTVRPGFMPPEKKKAIEAYFRNNKILGTHPQGSRDR